MVYPAADISLDSIDDLLQYDDIYYNTTIQVQWTIQLQGRKLADVSLA